MNVSMSVLGRLLSPMFSLFATRILLLVLTIQHANSMSAVWPSELSSHSILIFMDVKFVFSLLTVYDFLKQMKGVSDSLQSIPS